MKFHFPSYALGFFSGLAVAFASRRARPLLLEVTTAFYELSDLVVSRIAMRREDLEDLLAEARCRARAARERAAAVIH